MRARASSSALTASAGAAGLLINVATKDVASHQVKPKAVLLAGPTASGKSALALTLADQFGGVIINADSMQVYRDLRIITARPTPDDEARAPHLLYGHVDAADNYSVGRWCVDASAALAQAERAGQLPILVGGTGLYFKALTRGLAVIPPIPLDIRSGVRKRLEAEGLAPLYAELVRCDPATARRLMPGDRARITRALEVFLATGRGLADWHLDGMKPAVDPGSAVKVFIDADREELYRRIDARFDAMIAAGAVEEVRALSRRKLDPSLPAMKAHGVPWLIRHLNSEITLTEAADGSKGDTRHYTKRQATWFRHQLPDWTWAVPADAVRAVVDALKP
jgi:tRNA dimethylallyltransferase